MSYAREWNSVVATPPPTSLKPAPISQQQQRPSMQQLLPRLAAASTPAVPCRYTKSEMLAMYSPTDRPPSDFHASLPVVASECQAPVTSEPPSVAEREIFESGTWYMPSARPIPNPSSAVKPGRGSAPRPTRSAFARALTSAPDVTPPPTEHRPTRFNWRQDPHCPGSTEADAVEHRRVHVAEKPAAPVRAAPIGRSDAALSWRRDDNEGSSSSVPAPAPPAERPESDAAPEPSAWRSPTLRSRRQSSVPAEPDPAVEGLVDQIRHLEPSLCDSWWYQDPSGTVRGPFSADEMRDWYQQNYFQLTLPVRCRPEQPFTPLGALFLQGNPAFLDHVPVVMAAPVEARRPLPMPTPQPYLPVHHHLPQHVLPQHLPVFHQPPPQPLYHPHAFAPAPAHPADTRLHSSMPFVNAPVLDQQQAEPWASVRQAPVPDVVRQTPWMPFFNSAPVPAPANVIERVVKMPEPAAAVIHEPVPAPAERQAPPADLSVFVQEVAVAAPESEPVYQVEDLHAVQRSPSPEQGASSGSESDYEEDDAEDEIASVSASAPSVEPTSSTQSVDNAPTVSSSPAQSSGWVSSPMSTAAPVKSLLEIQREEEEAHWKAQQTLKAQQEALRESQAQSHPDTPTSSSSAWGSVSSKPAARSLLEIQKLEEIMQTSTKAAPKPASSGWAGKVAPMQPSSWCPAPRPAAMSMRQIQEEEQSVLCQQQPSSQTQPGESAPQRSGWSAAVSGSAWPRPAASSVALQRSATRPAQSAVTARLATSMPAQKPAQSCIDSEDDAPFWTDAKKKSSNSDSSVHARNDFGGPMLSPEFREWCQTQLSEISSDCDISLAEFLLTLESSDAIREYIYEYLGRSAKAEAFATGFLQLKEFDDSKLVVQSSRLHSSESSKLANSDSQDPSKKSKKNRRRRKKKSDP